MKKIGITQELQASVAKGIAQVFGQEIDPNTVVINATKKEFAGEYTVVIFPFVKLLKKSPKEVGDQLSEYLITETDIVKASNLVAGFLNLEMTDESWKSTIKQIREESNFGVAPPNGKKIMIEFSSPNTNKPLHLGHIRNILLGHSSSLIHKALGYEVIQTQVVNDRGIAVCKSMYAWEHFANGATPDSSQIKGDHFVGQYYVGFDKALKEEYQKWQDSEEAKVIFKAEAKEQDEELFFKKYKNKYFNEHSKIGIETKEMLLKWEAGDEDTISLWKKLNDWVYEGFGVTYKNLGVEFDINYYESDTYKLGKAVVDEFLSQGLFFKEEDGSIWIDLEDVGMDKKILLRSDGTSVYMTQDLGTAQQRYKDYGIDSMVYVVADEQNYHFKVLFEILKRMGEPYADGLYHLAYGMVDLPTGKMKSREGTVVDADDLIKEVIEEAGNSASERGGMEDLNEAEQQEIFRKVGLGALKYHMIKVNPKKRMTFDPKESVDMQGVTAPYIQNAFVRIKSIVRKLGSETLVDDYSKYELQSIEKELIQIIANYPSLVEEAGANFDPSSISSYAYSLAKTYHRFYQELKILKAETPEAKKFRLILSEEVAKVIEKSMGLLGIEMPKRM